MVDKRLRNKFFFDLRLSNFFRNHRFRSLTSDVSIFFSQVYLKIKQRINEKPDLWSTSCHEIFWKKHTSKLRPFDNLGLLASFFNRKKSSNNFRFFTNFNFANVRWYDFISHNSAIKFSILKKRLINSISRFAWMYQKSFYMYIVHKSFFKLSSKKNFSVGHGEFGFTKQYHWN